MPSSRSPRKHDVDATGQTEPCEIDRVEIDPVASQFARRPQIPSVEHEIQPPEEPHVHTAEDLRAGRPSARPEDVGEHGQIDEIDEIAGLVHVEPEHTTPAARIGYEAPRHPGEAADLAAPFGQ